MSEQYPARPYQSRSDRQDRRTPSSRVGDLLDQLEGLVNDGVRFPMTSKVMIEEEEFIEIVDGLREAMAEIQRQSRAPSVEPMGMPPGTAARPSTLPPLPEGLADNEIIQVAQQRADALLAEAQQRAQEIVSGADTYALEVLGKVETELNRLVATVRRGKATLEESSSALPADNDLSSPPSPPARARGPITPQYLTGPDEPRRRGTPRDRER